MAAGVPSTNQIIPFSQEALHSKSKLGARMELPGLFYNQYTPTAANLTSGTVLNNGASMIGANQLGLTTAGTLPWGGDAAVTFSSSSGLLASFTTSSFMPTTLTYDQMPVKIVPAAGAVMPTGLIANQVYYWQFVSATTGRFAATPNGAVIAYTDAGSGTLYCQAATQYWGSPVLPAGFLVASDTLNQSTPSSPPSPGCTIHVDILGNALATTTNVSTLSVGLVSAAGTWTQIASVAVARAAIGPFGFVTTADIVIQQYGLAAVTAPYNAIGMARGTIAHQQPVTAGTSVASAGLWGKVVSLDLTQTYTVDVRVIQATPAVGEYYEPCAVRMWAYN